MSATVHLFPARAPAPPSLGPLFDPPEPWPFGALEPASFDGIMADPAWSFANFSAKGEAKNPCAHYRCLTLAEICALPVAKLAKTHCWLWLWATHPMKPHAIHAMAAWGFNFVTEGEWLKRWPSGKLAFGAGYVLRSSSEPFIIGKIGRPRVHSHSERSTIEAPPREHSRKPDEAYAMAERLFGPGRRADLFSREARPGWHAWGDELDKFDAEAVT